MKTLIVDYDVGRALRLKIMLTAKRAYHRTEYCKNLEEAIEALDCTTPEDRFDLVMLHYTLEDSNLRDALTAVKRYRKDIEIFVLADQAPLPAEDPMIAAIRKDVHYYGGHWECWPADPDYLFAQLDMISRRRAQLDGGSTIHWCGLTICTSRNIILGPDQGRIELPPRQWQAFTLLIENRGSVVDRNRLMKIFSADDRSSGRKLVDIHINKLRDKLKPYHVVPAIETKRGVGYMALTDEMFTNAGGYSRLKLALERESGGKIGFVQEIDHL